MSNIFNVGRSSADYETLINELNLCKKKLARKKESLDIIAKDFEKCVKEKESYRAELKNVVRNCHCSAVSNCFLSQEFKGYDVEEHPRLRSASLDQNKCLQNEIKRLNELYAEAQEDIKLLRETIARQRIGDSLETATTKSSDRELLITEIEQLRIRNDELQMELDDLNDQKNESSVEKEYFHQRSDRLNAELNRILSSELNEILDIDTLLMENRYLKECVKVLQEDKKQNQAQFQRLRECVKKKKTSSFAKLGCEIKNNGFVVTPAQVRGFLMGGSSKLPVTSSSLNDLQSLAVALTEAINDKSTALIHQRNTNKILAKRITDLENKLKSVETFGDIKDRVSQLYQLKEDLRQEEFEHSNAMAEACTDNQQRQQSSDILDDSFTESSSSISQVQPPNQNSISNLL